MLIYQVMSWSEMAQVLMLVVSVIQTWDGIMNELTMLPVMNTMAKSSILMVRYMEETMSLINMLLLLVFMLSLMSIERFHLDDQVAVARVDI